MTGTIQTGHEAWVGASVCGVFYDDIWNENCFYAYVGSQYYFN